MTDYAKGDIVTLSRDVSADGASGYGQHRFTAGDTAEVTTVRRETITVRIRKRNYGKERWYSFNVPRTALAAPNGEAWDAAAVAAAKAAKPKPRKLGTVPKGTLPDGTAYISPDHPGLQWLWEDAAKASASYCYVYDEIANKLGIPGRLRTFDAEATINGLKVTARLQARSQKEADATLRLKLEATG